MDGTPEPIEALHPTDHCPVCKGTDSPHPDWEPSGKLGTSWWKLVGFNAPNRCAVQLRAHRLGLIPDLETDYEEATE
jgi:hypothetical protein